MLYIFLLLLLSLFLILFHYFTLLYFVFLLLIIFFLGSLLLLYLNFYFLGISLIIVYIGAIAILFLFLIMTISQSNDSFISHFKYLNNKNLIWLNLLSNKSFFGIYLGYILILFLNFIFLLEPNYIYTLSGSGGIDLSWFQLYSDLYDINLYANLIFSSYTVLILIISFLVFGVIIGILDLVLFREIP